MKQLLVINNEPIIQNFFELVYRSIDVQVITLEEYPSEDELTKLSPDYFIGKEGDTHFCDYLIKRPFKPHQVIQDLNKIFPQLKVQSSRLGIGE